MMIARLALTDFRNHAAALVEPGPGFVLLSGPNGAGKTNMLEAVSLLTPGRGLRQVPISEMARSDGAGGSAWRDLPLPARREASEGGPITATGRSRPRPSRERGQSAPAPSPPRPTAARCASTAPPPRSTALSEWLSVLWLTPAMDRLFADSAGGRRRFLDRLTLALEPGHATHAARYEAAMRARNKLLAEPDGADPPWLAALEAGMAEHGAALGEARARTVAALTEAMADQTRRRFPPRRARARRVGRQRPRRRAQGLARPRCRRRPRAGRPAPPGSRRHPCRQAAARRARLDRRTEGAAARPGPRPRRSRRQPPRRAADPAARRGRRPPRPRPPRGPVRPPVGPRPGVDDRHRARVVRRHRPPPPPASTSSPGPSFPPDWTFSNFALYCTATRDASTSGVIGVFPSKRCPARVSIQLKRSPFHAGCPTKPLVGPSPFRASDRPHIGLSF